MIEQVYLHIGQPKTGSSFVQSALANSQDILTTHGFTYPMSQTVETKAQKGGITSGNFRPRPGALEALLTEAAASKAQKLLISGEAIFLHLIKNGPEFITTMRDHLPQANIGVFCYLRDPVDHAVSSYQQKIKRGGYTGTLEESLERFDPVANTIKVLTILREQDIAITVCNYSKHRANVLAPVEAWLGLADTPLNRPPKQTINRSLSNSELELQRALNAYLGKHARSYVSDPMCEQLPDIQSEFPPIAKSALARFIDRMKGGLESPQYQDLVPEAERPFIGTIEDHIEKFPPPNDDETYVLSKDQMRVFAESVGQELQRVKHLREKLVSVQGHNKRLLKNHKGAANQQS